MSGPSIAKRLVKALGALLLAVAAFGLAAFAAEALLAALEGEATTASLVAATIALALFLWCARTLWRLGVGRMRSE
jgi:hypothetical protein